MAWVGGCHAYLNNPFEVEACRQCWIQNLIDVGTSNGWPMLPVKVSICWWIIIVGLVFAARTGILYGQREEQFAQRRREMVDKAIIDAGVRDERVLAAMRSVPRHRFVLRSQRDKAYFDMALPIGAQQTISSPFIVALMTESLDPRPTDRVLEIGTGSGYQAAILSGLVKEVYSIEIVERLGYRAQRILSKLNYDNVHVRIGDGYAGWPEHAPFDKVIVTCSPQAVPQPLVEQLNEGGRMVIPVGQRYQQTLFLLSKMDSKLHEETLRPTLFVPMTGKALPDNTGGLAVDKENPKLQLVNSSFEEDEFSTGLVPGWYYQRQLRRMDDPRSPHKSHYLRFENETPGRASHALQGFSIDGREVPQLVIRAWVQTEDVQAPKSPEPAPSVAVTFYDSQQRELGHQWMGPWHGTELWNQVKLDARVPRQARHGILRIGLFGAVGTFDIDHIRLENPSSTPTPAR